MLHYDRCLFRSPTKVPIMHIKSPMLNSPIEGEIDSPPVETKNEKTLDMASWANLGLTGNVRDVVTQQVINIF